ncbi:hypothetical protein [Flavobacterium kingsejongi]|uniref:Uncharacterized protein n=1 Tax=Flavobacterium kingsejongi TaxID=1678728 RepID=A0A2S1LKN7_9FLAO|nr:hypothetical protein [Flavobacterium kingsejongi]AWG24241.1 hypothetical protein FK004_02885 [Flavobacterium kingsejongi]
MKKTTIVIAILISLTSIKCGDGINNEPFLEFDPYDTALSSRIEAYQDIKSAGTPIQKDKQSMYIDFSDGIQMAFNIPQNKELISQSYNTLMGSELEAFKLGSKIIDFIPKKTTPTELGMMLNDSKQYKDIYAPIEETVKDIISKNREAFLITDFEEYGLNSAKPVEITETAFLKEEFIEWLKNGNSIRFYVSDYSENGIQKHLYFTVFYAPNSAILPKLHNVLSALPHFDLTNQGYQLSQGYETTTSGGIFYDPTAGTDVAKNVLELDKKNYVNGLTEHKNYEFYPLLLDWEYIEKTKNELQFKDFFRKLFIDLSNTDSYNISDLDVKVADITEDFELFAKCKEALKHKPKITKGSDAENELLADENDPIALACYDKKGKIKDEWVYKPIATPSIPDFFTLNKTLFANSKKDSKNKKAEIGVVFDSQFAVKNIPNPQGLMRVDIIVKNAKPGTEKLDWFTWQSTVNPKSNNTALKASIQSTLADPKINPVNTVIYTYYIKTNANK